MYFLDMYVHVRNCRITYNLSQDCLKGLEDCASSYEGGCVQLLICVSTSTVVCKPLLT